LAASSLALRAQQDNSHHGRKYKAPPPSSRIEVTVVRDYNGKPIAQAHVIFHPVEGDRDKGSLELKTNEDGKVIIDVIPVGDTVRLQVIADGFQTYGQDFKIDKPEMSMEVRLKRPAPQYSIYGNSSQNSGSGNSSGAGGNSGSGTNSGSGKSSNSSPGSAPPASGNKPSGSAGQSDAQPNARQPQRQTN
jgi:hypothetical protein